mgnify:CR=1 FL=1
MCNSVKKLTASVMALAMMTSLLAGCNRGSNSSSDNSGGASGSGWEYTYAKLQKDTVIKGTSLYDSFLIRNLDGMLQDYPKHKSKKFIDMTIAGSDSVFAYTLNERYKDAFAEDQMVENEVLLMSPDGKKTTLSKVLNSLKGKTVYVDFWASWCRPCCAE